MENSRKSPRINIGSASLVVIFATLCLTVFAVLSLTTANAERKLAEKAAQAVQDYYAADLACARKAEEIAGILALPLDDGDREERLRQLGAQLSGSVISFQEKIDVNQRLLVELQPLEEGGGFRVLKWQALDVGEWNPDRGIAVWEGN